MTLPRRLKRLLTAPLVLLAALLIFLEDFLWDELGRAFSLLAKLPLWARLENWIRSLPPWAALPMFLVPMAVLFPLKIAALWMMAHHHVLVGIQVILLAKVVGTAIAARLFMLLKPTLLKVEWFARGYSWITAWKARVLGRVHEMAWYRLARAMLASLRARIAKLRGEKGLWYRLRRWQLKLRARRRKQS